MLKKLFKYDFEASCRIFLLLHGIIMLISGLGKLIFTLIPDALDSFPLVSILIPTYVLLCFGLYLGFRIYLIVRFYRSMFSNEGYLYHTLPVKPHQLLLSKLLCSTLLTLLSDAVLILCALVLLAGDPMRVLMEQRDLIASTTQMFFNASPGDCVLFAALYLPFSYFYMYSAYFAAVSLGQVLLQKHRVLGAFVSYLIFHMVLEVLTVIPLFVFLFSSGFATATAAPAPDLLAAFYRFTYFLTFGIAIVGSVVFFFVSHYIMKKKLNLE